MLNTRTSFLVQRAKLDQQSVQPPARHHPHTRQESNTGEHDKSGVDDFSSTLKLQLHLFSKLAFASLAALGATTPFGGHPLRRHTHPESLPGMGGRGKIRTRARKLEPKWAQAKAHACAK